MVKDRKRPARRNPMAGSLAHGAHQPKVVPTAKQKEARRRKPKHPPREEEQ